MRFFRKHWLVVACLVAVALRMALGCALPLCIHAGALYDDAWAVDAARSIAAGEWLGAYDDVTLIKNVGFPLYLAAVIKLPGSYLFWTTLLNCAAATFLAVALRPLFRRDWAWLLLFAGLLFCPVGFATDTFQRVYRNSIVAAQVELIFGAYLGAYLRLKGITRASCDSSTTPRARAVAPWMIVGAIALAWFWISREDSIWVAPFVCVATAVMVVMLVLRLVRGSGREDALKAGVFVLCLVMLMLPLATTAAASHAQKSVNESHYGLATGAEINSGEFARFIKDLYAIEPDTMPTNLHVACPHSSVVKAYELSPTLASIRDAVEERFYNWGDKYDNDPGDGEVNGGEFFWVFRLAGSKAGIYTKATDAEAFWGKCADELEAAFAQGAVNTRSVMPSSIMTPWRSEYAGMLLPSAVGIYAQSCSYADVTAEPFTSQGSSKAIATFEQTCGAQGYSGQGYELPAAVATGIIWIYRICGSLLGVLGLIAFATVLVAWVRERRGLRAQGVRRIHGTQAGPLALVLTAIFLGTLSLIAGLTYTRVSSFSPISYYYYGSAAYPLLLAFNVLGVAGVARALMSRRTHAAQGKDREGEE